MMRRAILIAAALTACSTIEPERAHAYDLCDRACVLSTGAALLLPPIIFVTAQVVYAAEERWFPPGWAVPELIYGGLMMSLMFAIASDASDPGGVLVFSALYGWLTLHAILSIALDDRRVAARAARSRPGARFGAAPVPGGAVAGVFGFW